MLRAGQSRTVPAALSHNHTRCPVRATLLGEVIMEQKTYTVRLKGERAEYFQSLLQHLIKESERAISAQEVFEELIDICMANSSIIPISTESDEKSGG